MADIIETVQLMKDFDLNNGCVRRAIWGVSCQNLGSTSEEVLILLRRD
jgi:hypothetical protein